MTPEEFAALMARDAAAEACATCGGSAGGPHADDPEKAIAECNAAFRADWERRSVLPLWAKENPRPRTCSNPAEHHPFVPGGVASWDDASVDRRALLDMLRQTAGWIATVTQYPFDWSTRERPPAVVFDLIVEAHHRAEVGRVGPDHAGTLEEFREACEIEATWEQAGG